MSKQKGILEFFKPAIKKREIEAQGLLSNKRLKSEHDDEKEINADSSETIAKLTIMKEKCSILDHNIGASWFSALEHEFTKSYFQKLSDFVSSERKIHKVYPDNENVWAWTRLSSLENIKVVIIGQDPYHNPGQAHGLCFSVPRGVSPPPSLLNIYKELKTDIEGFKPPSHGDLTKWAKQGVLLLNASLTVRQNSPNSHADKGWEKLTDAVIKAVSDGNKGVVFLLWGAFAQKKAACVNKNKHHLLKAVHPSPLSAMRGFFGCKHFSACNKILEEEGKEPIDWTLD